MIEETQAMQSGKRWKWAVQGLLAISLLLMLAHLVVYVAYGVALIRFPFDYDQGEGFELYDTILLSRGEWPYRNNETFPFYASNYPPVYHVVLIPMAWLFGAEYWYGRLIAFIGTFIAAGGIGYAVHRETRHRSIAVLSGLAFLASNYIYHIGPLLRQHMFMVMFEVLAMVALANAFTLPKEHQRRRLIIVVALLLLAGYTKQLAYATVIAALVWLLIRNPRRAMVYGAGLGVAAGLVFLWINITTDGEWWNNIIAANVNAYYPGQFAGLARQFLRLHWALLIPAGLLVVYELYFTRLSAYSVWFVFAGVNTALSGKWGAGDSYFASFIAAICILAGIFAGRTLNGQWTFPADHIYTQRFRGLLDLIQQRRVLAQRLASVAVLGLFIVYGLSVVKIPTEGAFWGSFSDALGVEPQPGHRYPLYDAAGWAQGYAAIGHLPSQEDIDNGWEIVERIRDSEKPVLSEEAGFSLQADRRVITNPTQLKNLYENDLYDPTNLVAMIHAQEFGHLIFRAQFYPPPVMAAAFEAYEPTEVIPMNGFGYEIWSPSPTWDEMQVIKDYLSSAQPGDDPLTTTIARDDVDHIGNWLHTKLGYWAWQPVVPAPPDSPEGCPRYGFVQDGQREVTITVCDGDADERYQLGVTPPEPFSAAQ